MPNLTSPQTIRAIMQKHGFRFSKSLGQNFIINPGVCPKMAEMGGAAPGVGTLEIGPGIGVLTEQLAQRCDRVVSIEIDSALLPVLEETLADYSNVRIMHADVMKIDLHKLIADSFSGMDVVVCANLPYYITSPVIMRLLESKLPVRGITVMVQQEAAKRICAPLPSRHAGAITAAIQYYARPQALFSVSKGSFYPAPKVDSAVIRMDIRETPPVAVQDENMLFRVVRGAFSQRRKTLLNALSSSLAIDKARLGELLTQAGVASAARAEALSLKEFAAVADVLSNCVKKRINL